jgi:hypothetical protein
LQQEIKASAPPIASIASVRSDIPTAKSGEARGFQRKASFKYLASY